MVFSKSRLFCVLACFLLVEVIPQSTAETVLVETQHVSNDSRIQLAMLSGDGGEKKQVTPMNVAFDLPDLTVSVKTATGTAQLEAYKSVNNDKILQDTSGTKISQLFWVTVGLPNFIKSPSPLNPSDVKLFHFHSQGFSTYLDMKTDTIRDALATAARDKYKVDISDNQVVDLILSKFECSTILLDNAKNKYFFIGKVTDFRNFPLRMDFEALPGNHDRNLFEEALKESVIDLRFDCNMESSGGKVIKTNTLTISANQIQEIGLEEKLFGPAGSNGKDNVYVTRDQMTGLSSEMYSTLNIVEEYQMPEFQFKEAFVDGIISQISSSVFDQVPIDAVLASLSKYGFDIGADIQPDVIKKDVGSILKIEKTDSHSRIVLEDESERDSSSKQSRNGAFGLNVGVFGLTRKWGRTNEQQSSSKDRSLSDQLYELNEETKNEAQWEIEGNRVIPKSLNVARLTRAKMSKTLTFNRIRIKTFEAPFHRAFSLYTHTASAPDSFFDWLTSRFEHLENMTKQAKLDSDRQIAATIAAIDSEKSRLDSVSSRALRRCRICIRQSEGIRANLAKDHTSCSGWSDSGGWSQSFRTDVCIRRGYCTYQWVVECQT